MIKQQLILQLQLQYGFYKLQYNTTITITYLHKKFLQKIEKRNMKFGIEFLEPNFINHGSMKMLDLWCVLNRKLLFLTNFLFWNLKDSICNSYMQNGIKN